MDAVHQTMAQLQHLFVQKMDAYQGELQAASPSPSITALSADFTAFRSFIMTALRSLQDQLGLVMQLQDDMEMRARRKILLFHGVPEAKEEVTADAVAKAVVTQMKINDFTTAHISRCHRMGRATAADKPRPILFKIRDLDMRSKIWHAKTSLKGSSLTLSEFLTKPRHETFMSARQSFGVQKCWTRDVFVYVLDADGVRHRIRNVKELEKIPVLTARKATATAPTTRARDTANAPKSRRAASASKK